MNQDVSRKDLLTALIDQSNSITVVDIKEVTMGPNTKAPLHLHPCSTLGVVTEGTISFQIEGEDTKYLKAGDAFHEPKDVRVAKFNNESDVSAKFVVFYLLEEKDNATIKILE